MKKPKKPRKGAVEAILAEPALSDVTLPLEEAIVEYDMLDPNDDVQALRQAHLQAYGAPMPDANLRPFADALAAGQLSRLAAVLELVDAARREGRDVTLHFSQPMQHYLPGLSPGAGTGRGVGWAPPRSLRVVDLSDLGALDDAGFVRFGYLHILGKPADAEGLAHHLYRMQTGRTRLDVLSELAQAAKLEGEAVTFQIRAEALTTLGQNPVASLKALLSGDAEACIAALYQTVLGKPVDADGMAHYLWQISRGRRRFEIYLELRAVAAREGRAVFVDCDVDEDALGET
jgi:hypothetical protein